MNLIKGDCIEVMKDLSDNIAQVFFCDLPYGEISCKWDCKIDLDIFWKEALRIGKEDCVFCFTATMKFAYTLIQSNHKMFRYDLVYIKNNASNPMMSAFRHMPKHELILVFYKKKPKWNKEKYHTKIRDVTLYVQKNPDDCFNIPSGSIRKNDTSPRWEPRLPTSIIKQQINSIGKSIHPTRKDPQVIKDLLKYWTDPGDIVIDPTMGSGATGEACRDLGLRFIGIEKEDKWFQVCKQRLLNIDGSNEK